MYYLPFAAANLLVVRSLLCIVTWADLVFSHAIWVTPYYMKLVSYGRKQKSHSSPHATDPRDAVACTLLDGMPRQN